MAVHAHSTAAPTRRLLPTLTDFSPKAIMARANAYAAERAAEQLAARPPCTDGRTGAEILAAIEAEIERQADQPLLPAPAPLPSLTSALARLRAIFGGFDGEAARG